jgi:predicted kinase
MNQPLICHLLIGIPGSGKSTFAQILAAEIDGLIIATDAIRRQLYGAETIQGDWLEIEAEIFQQMEIAIANHQPVIYDATNVSRTWRMDFFSKTARWENIRWVGWLFETPIEICQERNSQRERQVPPVIIERMNETLQSSPPDKTEGMMAIYPVPCKDLATIRDHLQGVLSAIEIFPNRI